MPWVCCAVGCTNRQGKCDKRFYRFPKDPDQRSRWISAVKRANWMPTEHSRLCSAHFVTGQYSRDQLNIDYAPSLFSYSAHSPTKLRNTQLRYTRAVNRAKRHASNSVASLAKRHRSVERGETEIKETDKTEEEPGVNENEGTDTIEEDPGVTEIGEANTTEEPGVTEIEEADATEEPRVTRIEETDTIEEEAVVTEIEEAGVTEEEPGVSRVTEIEETDTTEEEPGVTEIEKAYMAEEPRMLEMGTDDEGMTDEPENQQVTEFEEMAHAQTLELLEYEICELQFENERLRSIIAEDKETIENCRLENQRSIHALNQLKHISHATTKLQASHFGAGSLFSDEKTRFYTGLSSYKLFDKLLQLLVPLMGKEVTSYTKCSPADEFFATLVKLRLGILNKDIAYRLNVSESTFSAIFHKWINLMYRELKQLIVWPDRETLRANLPSCFKKHFSDVVCIIDCFEIFIEKPDSLEARAITYSNYKRHNTIKVLIGVTPTGTICFLSKAWGGRVSDKMITQESGFLRYICHGDVVLADRGFNVTDDLAVIGAQLKLPAFTRGKKQLSQEEVEKTRQIARVRIHVERVIGLLRNKYRLLKQTLPINLIKRPSDTDTATIDKILAVTAALTNLSKSVV